MTGSRRTAVIAMAALAVGFAYRWSFVEVMDGKLWGDNVVVALMAAHILDGQHYVFYWGQSYMGSLEAYTVAALAAVFGLSDRVAMAGTLVYGMAYLWSFLPLGRRLGGEPVGRLAICLAALCPPLLAIWSSSPRGGYPETLLFGNLLFILAIDLARDRPTDWGVPRALALGALAGVAFWTNLLVVTYFVPVAALLLWQDPRVFARRHFWLALLAFFVGSAPLWIDNLASGFDTFSLVRDAGEEVSRRANVERFFLANGPRLLGVRGLVGDGDMVLGVLGVATGLLLVAALLVGAWTGRGIGVALCVGLIATVLFAYLPTRYGGWNTQRYLLPLYSAIFPLLAIACHRAWQRWPPLVVVALSLVVAVHGRAAWRLHDQLVGPYRLTPMISAVIDYCERHGIRQGYAGYSEALLLTYRSQERLIFLGRGLSRYPLDEIDHWDPRALLVKGAGARIASGFRSSGVSFEHAQIEGYSLFHDLRPVPLGRPLDREGWQVAAYPNPDDAGWAADGNPETRWASKRSQRPGMAFAVKLAKAEQVGGVRIELGDFEHDSPRGLEVFARRAPGAPWESIAVLRNAETSFAVSPEGQIELDGGRLLDLRFAPRLVKELRLVQTAADPVFDWSIAELQIYAVDPVEDAESVVLPDAAVATEEGAA